MSKFHITITNNETREILDDKDTDCIIGAYAADGGAYAIGHTSCNGGTLLGTISSVERAIDRICENSPELKMLREFFGLAKEKGFDPLLADDETDTDN